METLNKWSPPRQVTFKCPPPPGLTHTVKMNELFSSAWLAEQVLYHIEFKFTRHIYIHSLLQFQSLHDNLKFAAVNSNWPGMVKFATGNSNLPQKFKFTKANPNSLRQTKIHCGKRKFITANSNSLRQIQIHHDKFKIRWGKFTLNVTNSKFATANTNSLGKFKLTAANLSSPRQIQNHWGNFLFTTANSNSHRQIQIYHGKFKFTASNPNSTH